MNRFEAAHERLRRTIPPPEDELRGDGDLSHRRPLEGRMKDEETGIDPVATDGEPDSEKVADIESKRNKRKGSSIADRAKAAAEGAAADDDGGGEGDDPTGEEDDGQFAFVVEEQGRKITMGTLVARGTPIEYRVTMGGKSVGGRGGLLDPADTNILLLVRGVVDDVHTKFTRDSDEVITKATIYMHIAPKSVVNARTEQAHVMLHGEPPSTAATG